MTHPTQAEIEAALKEVNDAYEDTKNPYYTTSLLLVPISIYPTIKAALENLSQPQQQEAVGEIDLAGFVDKLFTVHWKNSSCDIDGEDLQEWGEAFGITKAETYDRDLHGSHHEYEWDAVHGESTIYVLSDAFKAMLKAAPPAEDGEA